MKQTLKKIALKFLLLAAVLVLLNMVYRHTFYERDLRDGCTLMERALLPAEEGADIIYLGESSNHTIGDNDTDTLYISQMIEQYMPGHHVANLDKDASHAGVSYDIMRNIPHSAPVKVVVVTVNMRAFSTEWVYSNLEVPLSKERLYMRNAPALWKRMLVVFKAYPHWSEAERGKLVKKKLRHQTFNPPAGLPYRNAAAWDRALGNEMWARGEAEDTISLATHYIKSFAVTPTASHPRIRDLDRIARLCQRRGWLLVLNILPDNEEQMAKLGLDDVVTILREASTYVEQRYRSMGVVVVNNQGIAPDSDFIDRTFPTEHYCQGTRRAIAQNIANAINNQSI